MRLNDCEQLRIDNNWDLTRTNACHIGVMNKEMGMLAGSQMEIQASLGIIGMKMDMLFGVFGVVAVSIIALVIKKMWGHNGKPINN